MNIWAQLDPRMPPTGSTHVAKGNEESGQTNERQKGNPEEGEAEGKKKRRKRKKMKRKKRKHGGRWIEPDEPTILPPPLLLQPSPSMLPPC